MSKSYDVIIIGSGLAGLYAALHLCEGQPDIRVLMLSKQAPEDSSSSLAQGGVAAVLEHDDDSFALHRDDTLAAGNYINDIEAVELFVREGPEDVKKVMGLGVEFDRNSNGDLSMTLEGGHSRRRIVHRADSTGREMVDKLLPHVRSLPGVTLLEDAAAYAAEKTEQGGFIVDTVISGEKRRFCCHYLLLATGGIGQIYRNTTNPTVCTGDGIRLAYELGAKLRNLSFVQFHPTAFASDSSFLISEAVRGEGGYLLNDKHERFMHNYDPRLELAPRDIVSKAIILESRHVDDNRFYLDIRHRGRDFLKQRFPGIYATCLERGVDIASDLIPVFPCQHYHMGGVDVDLHSRTSIPGLYAAGECAHTGLHGGNRLASNSLPEALVFGRRAAEDILVRFAPFHTANVHPQKQPTANCQLPIVNSQLRSEIQSMMQASFFVFPECKKLPAAAAQMRDIYERLAETKYEITRDYAELRSLACVAMLILEELLC